MSASRKFHRHNIEGRIAFSADGCPIRAISSDGGVLFDVLDTRDGRVLETGVPVGILGEVLGDLIASVEG